MAIKGTPTCWLIADSFARSFLAADELAHLQEVPTSETDWKSVEKAKKQMEVAISSLQAHLGEEAATTMGVGFGKIEQGLSYHDIVEVHNGAEKIQEVLLRDGLIAVVQECGRTEH